MYIDSSNLSGLGWLLVFVYIKRFYIQILNACSFDYTAVAGSGMVGPVNRFTTPVGWP